MFSLLSFDPLLLIIFNLTNLHDVIHLSEINKNMNYEFDDNLYFYWGRNLYTKEFINKAEQRTPSISKSYGNTKMELLRLDNFQNHLIKNGFQQWNNEDFFVYWDGLERSRGRGTPPNPPF